MYIDSPRAHATTRATHQTARAMHPWCVPSAVGYSRDRIPTGIDPGNSAFFCNLRRLGRLDQGSGTSQRDWFLERLEASGFVWDEKSATYKLVLRPPERWELFPCATPGASLTRSATVINIVIALWGARAAIRCRSGVDAQGGLWSIALAPPPARPSRALHLQYTF
jgi:hypothetical protein